MTIMGAPLSIWRVQSWADAALPAEAGCETWLNLQMFTSSGRWFKRCRSYTLDLR